MKMSLTRALLAGLLLTPMVWAAKGEREAKKLDKELRKVSLTAAVPDGRRVVNRVMAGQLGIPRRQLVEERRTTRFVYGQLFGAHEVARSAGLAFARVAEQMAQGHSLLEISEQHSVDLKGILANTKKLNKAINQELDRIASGQEDERAEDVADAYDPANDSLTADTADFNPTEIAQANDQVHHRGGPFGEGGPLGRGRGASGQMGGPQGQGQGIGAGMGGGRGHGPH